MKSLWNSRTKSGFMGYPAQWSTVRRSKEERVVLLKRVDAAHRGTLGDSSLGFTQTVQWTCSSALQVSNCHLMVSLDAVKLCCISYPETFMQTGLRCNVWNFGDVSFNSIVPLFNCCFCNSCQIPKLQVGHSIFYIFWQLWNWSWQRQ